MRKEQLQARSRDELAELARKKGFAGVSHLRKDKLIVKLIAFYKRAARVRVHSNGKAPARNLRRHLPRTRPQIAAARNTYGTTSTEEQIERSKYDVGIPTKDLSAKVPKDLPGGYGRDRIVVMVRDPYWLHAYWEMTRQAVQRAEAALRSEERRVGKEGKSRGATD